MRGDWKMNREERKEHKEPENSVAHCDLRVLLVILQVLRLPLGFRTSLTLLARISAGNMV